MRSTRIRAVLPVVLLTLAGLLVSGSPAWAEPSDDEGSASSARKKLETVARQYNNARARLAASTKKRDTLTRQVASGQREINTLQGEVDRVASATYRAGPSVTLVALVLDGRASDALSSADTLAYLGHRDAERIRTLRAARAHQSDQRAELDRTIATQRRQVADLKKRKATAQHALDQLTGDASAGYSGGSASAAPAPRNSDGSWPSESCSVDDPTTDGCLTPRTLHAYQEARKAGFTRYTACYRSNEDGGEHPRGRACDFSVTPGGFEGESSGANREYGNRLAAWFIANADRLGVLYVIFFRQIWLPGEGWRAYSGSGSPSAEHTNHVHLSVQ